MKKETKQHIKLLAEKFNHNIEYEKEVMLLKNNLNEIRIWEKDKYGINVSYNDKNNSLKEMKLEVEDFYEVLLEILMRTSIVDNLRIGTGILLTLEEWVNEEGDFAKEKLESLKRDLKNEFIEYRNLGGNRYEAEYFKGILIIMDDLCWAKSNVISVSI